MQEQREKETGMSAPSGNLNGTPSKEGAISMGPSLLEGNLNGPLFARGVARVDDDRLKCIDGDSADEQIQDMCQPSPNLVKSQTHRL